MLTTELMGGLGNQLFQICCLLSTSFDNKQKFVIEKKKILDEIKKDEEKT